MLRSVCRWLAGAMVLAVAGVAAGAAQAHPHVWINAFAELDYRDGEIRGIRVSWTFDDFFSLLLLEDFDKDRDRRFNAAEVDGIADQSLGSLKDFGYFTHIRVNGEAFDYSAVDDFSADVKNEIVTYAFTVPLPDGVDPRRDELVFAMFDITFYVALILDEHDPVRVRGDWPVDCYFDTSQDVQIGSAMDGWGIGREIRIACNDG